MTISKQQTALLFRLSISITVFGALLKYMTWPFVILGSLGMLFFHSIQLVQKEDRSALDYSRHLLIILFGTNYAFSLFQMPYISIVTLCTKLALIAFVGLYVKEFITPSNENSQTNLMINNLSTESLSFLLADLATVYIVIAFLFKILQWEFGIINANVLLVIGLCSALISILASPKALEK